MPAHSEDAGKIIREQAYAAGKMMDSSGWNGLLVRKITPSDIDLCFDGNGKILKCDFSRTCDNWDDLGRWLKGQRTLYWNDIRYSPHAAALCKHSVKPELGRRIDTLRDVDSFQIMLWDFEPVLSPVYQGWQLWQRFVQRWVNEPDGPLILRRSILGASVNRRTT